MKITVITVAYNSAATIADSIKSVAAQSHDNLEHIVIDGGSTDETASIVKREGWRVARFISEPDKGIYDAMNKGVRLATGDAVGFLNSDDWFASDQSLKRIDEGISGQDAAFGDLEYVRADDPSQVVRRWKAGKFRARQLRWGWMPPHPTFYARRDLLAKVGGFDTGLKIAADYDLMMRCLVRPGIRVGYVPDVVVKMRLGGVSNRSLQAMASKSHEDLTVIRRYGLGGWSTLAAKNLRKLPQFL